MAPVLYQLPCHWACLFNSSVAATHGGCCSENLISNLIWPQMCPRLLTIFKIKPDLLGTAYEDRPRTRPCLRGSSCSLQAQSSLYLPVPVHVLLQAPMPPSPHWVRFLPTRSQDSAGHPVFKSFRQPGQADGTYHPLYVRWVLPGLCALHRRAA